MTVKEAESVINQLKAEGHSDEVLLNALYRMYNDKLLTLSELDGLVNLIG